MNGTTEQGSWPPIIEILMSQVLLGAETKQTNQNEYRFWPQPAWLFVVGKLLRQDRFAPDSPPNDL